MLARARDAFEGNPLKSTSAIKIAPQYVVKITIIVVRCPCLLCVLQGWRSCEAPP